MSSLPGYRQWSIGITFLSDFQIQALNKRYLKKDTSTDVLAFNYGAKRFFPLRRNSPKQNLVCRQAAAKEDKPALLADIAISIETARRNAKIYNTTCRGELILYIIHGLLHICGYDDTTISQKNKMFKKQNEIFKKITAKITF